MSHPVGMPCVVGREGGCRGQREGSAEGADAGHTLSADAKVKQSQRRKQDSAAARRMPRGGRRGRCLSLQAWPWSGWRAEGWSGRFQHGDAPVGSPRASVKVNEAWRKLEWVVWWCSLGVAQTSKAGIWRALLSRFSGGAAFPPPFG